MKVLVVDDNRDAATSLSMLVELLGHEVRTAFDGVEDPRRRRPFDRRYRCCSIWGCRGWTFGVPANPHEPRGAHMTIVAVTGWGREDDRLKTERAGFDQHLVKPVAPAVITRILSGLAQAEK